MRRSKSKMGRNRKRNKKQGQHRRKSVDSANASDAAPAPVDPADDDEHDHGQEKVEEVEEVEVDQDAADATCTAPVGSPPLASPESGPTASPLTIADPAMGGRQADLALGENAPGSGQRAPLSEVFEFEQFVQARHSVGTDTDSESVANRSGFPQDHPLGTRSIHSNAGELDLGLQAAGAGSEVPVSLLPPRDHQLQEADTKTQGGASATASDPTANPNASPASALHKDLDLELELAHSPACLFGVGLGAGLSDVGISVDENMGVDDAGLGLGLSAAVCGTEKIVVQGDGDPDGGPALHHGGRDDNDRDAAPVRESALIKRKRTINALTAP